MIHSTITQPFPYTVKIHYKVCFRIIVCVTIEISIQIAIYDFQLDGTLKDTVVNALIAKAKAGVSAESPMIIPKRTKGKLIRELRKAIRLRRGTQEFVTTNFPESSKVKTKAIAGSYLMHSKYIVVDEGTANAAVWMGSANFTLGAWSLQENNILKIHSKELAAHYKSDFDDLWKTGNIIHTGANDYSTMTIGGAEVEVAFSPGNGSGPHRFLLTQSREQEKPSGCRQWS